MKIKKPAEMVEVCDFCEREKSYLTQCIVCKKEYCLLCRICIAGCIHSPDVCEECAKDERVRDIIVDKYAPRLQIIIKQRDEELRGIKKSVKRG